MKLIFKRFLKEFFHFLFKVFMCEFEIRNQIFCISVRNKSHWVQWGLFPSNLKWIINRDEWEGADPMSGMRFLQDHSDASPPLRMNRMGQIQYGESDHFKTIQIHHHPFIMFHQREDSVLYLVNQSYLVVCPIIATLQQQKLYLWNMHFPQMVLKVLAFIKLLWVIAINTKYGTVTTHYII